MTEEIFKQVNTPLLVVFLEKSFVFIIGIFINYF